MFAEWRGVDRRDELECLLAVRGWDVLYRIRWGEEEDGLGFECVGACELRSVVMSMGQCVVLREAQGWRDGV